MAIPLEFAMPASGLIKCGHHGDRNRNVADSDHDGEELAANRFSHGV